MNKLLIDRIIKATVYTVGVTVTGGYFTGIPDTPEQWGILVGAVVAIWWGKFSSSKTFIAMNRPVWTAEKRKQEALDALNGGK